MATVSEAKVGVDFDTADSPSKRALSSPGYNSSSSPSEQRKVELRMDEITNKFKNAFERMAELESLQLSMEQDTDDDMRNKWLQIRDRSVDSHTASKQRLLDVRKPSTNSLHTVSSLGTVLLSAKEERLSPVLGVKPIKMSHSEMEKDFETNCDNKRDDGVEERGFPPEWSYEEQFKKLYDLGDEPDRKEFLDKLFAFMQHRVILGKTSATTLVFLKASYARFLTLGSTKETEFVGTPVNRVPIMAKQTLDLYRLFKLVVERGGLVEVINKKIWRGIIKGLNLPSSVTSAAFTLRTQYMKYLYPYECSTLKLSSPTELQCAIDGNRRDTTRRPSIGHFTTMVEPEVGFYSDSTSPKSSCSSPTLKRASSPVVTQSMALRLPGQNEFLSPSFHGNNGIGFTPAIHRIAVSSADSRTKFDDRPNSPSYGNDRSYEPPYKKNASNVDINKQIILSPAPWANIKIKTPEKDTLAVHENGEEETSIKEENPSISSGKSPKHSPRTSLEQAPDNSIVVSIELNGIKYQGVLYAQQR